MGKFEDLGVKISNSSIGIISIDKVKITKDNRKIKASIIDISYCGDYYELYITFY